MLEAKIGRLTQLYSELQIEMQHEREAFDQERKLVQRTHDQQLATLRKQHWDEARRGLCFRVPSSPLALLVYPRLEIVLLGDG